jgi:hypothetical protein
LLARTEARQCVASIRSHDVRKSRLRARSRDAALGMWRRAKADAPPARRHSDPPAAPAPASPAKPTERVSGAARRAAVSRRVCSPIRYHISTGSLRRASPRAQDHARANVLPRVASILSMLDQLGLFSLISSHTTLFNLPVRRSERIRDKRWEAWRLLTRHTWRPGKKSGR